MKKIVAFIGSARKKATWQAVREFEKNLKRYEDVDFEYVFLKDYDLEFCRGCRLCIDRGEELCPLKDDRDLLLAKLEHADGVIFATPNYAFQVSARMKNFLDRFAYIYHRPMFFGKTFTAIVTQGAFGGKAIRKYLEEMGRNFGFYVVRGCHMRTLEPMTQAQQVKLKEEVGKAAARFHKGLARRKQPVPSFFRLMMFRMGRTSIKALDLKQMRDYGYYQEKGWFESDYYHETSLGPVKKLAGWMFDRIGRQFAKSI